MREDVKRMGHKIRNLWNIRHWQPIVNNSELHHTEYLQNMRIQIEPPHQRRSNIPQCKRCQAFFHTKGYCAHRLRCVKCGKSHSTEQGTLPKTHPATCLHCGESHAASYRGCKVYQEVIRTRISSTRPTASIHVTNTRRHENEIPAALQTTERWPKITYPQVTRNSIETPESKQTTHKNTH
jgi:hypothetical protein